MAFGDNKEQDFSTTKESKKTTETKEIKTEIKEIQKQLKDLKTEIKLDTNKNEAFTLQASDYQDFGIDKNNTDEVLQLQETLQMLYPLVEQILKE